MVSFDPEAVQKAVPDMMQIKEKETVSMQELQALEIEELEGMLEEKAAVMSDASSMADSARSLGMSENSETIQTAKYFWDEANESKQQIEQVLEQKKAELNKRVFSFDVFTKTNLSADDFNKLLAGTPLAGHGQDFYDMEQAWSVNGLFALSVGRTESSLGSSNLARNKNNYFGMKGCSFSSPHDGIMYFGELMNKPIYRGKSIESIAKIYCPPTHSHWAAQNRSFMQQFWNKLNA